METRLILSILLVSAVVLDLIFGDPRKVPHPVVYIGRLIRYVEKFLRKRTWSLKLSGFILLITVVTVTLSIFTLILKIGYLINPDIGEVVEIGLTTYFMYTALAATSMRVEVMKVYRALGGEGLIAARKALSWLVGRDTEHLSESEVIRGAIETTAENTIDGVLAPLFYMLIGLLIGLPVQLVYLYKAINTLDSMVGYIQEPYTHIGFASAKADDLVNYLPARLGSFFMLLAGGLLDYDMKEGLRIWRRDKRQHKSPNCGHPESVVAGLLGIQLGGTNTYFQQVLEKPTLGDSRVPLAPRHILDTLKILYGSEILTLIVLLACLWGVKI